MQLLSPLISLVAGGEIEQYPVHPPPRVISHPHPVQSDLDPAALQAVIGGDARRMPDRQHPRPLPRRGREKADRMRGMQPRPVPADPIRDSTP